MIVIPAIDLLDGQVVRLKQGRYEDVSQYDKSPADMAQWYVAHGAQRIHLVDLNGAKDGQLRNAKAIEAIRRSVSVALDLGGGIRNLQTAKQVMDLGINELILGSLLVKAPLTALAIAEAYPHQVSAGIDAHGHQVATEGWLQSSQMTVDQLLDNLKDWPLKSVIYTDIARDGMLTGPNLDMLCHVAQCSAFEVIASGGVASVGDLQAIAGVPGVVGAIVGKAILSGAIPIEEAFV